MKPEVLDLRGADDPRDVVHRAVERLAQGGLVALPTETVYGIAANALVHSAVERLVELKQRQPGRPLPLGIKSADEAFDWVPGMTTLGRRLARRCWPGPVTLVFNETAGEGLVRQLPEPVRQWVCPSGGLGLRVPAHPAVLDCQRLLPCPLVLTSASRGGGSVAVTGAEAVHLLGESIDLVLDDGPCRYGQPSSVVRVTGNRWQMLREGVVTQAAIERLARCLILFVCTGNTCRSPMAEGICRHLLSRRLGCKPDELSRFGYEVMSAGLAAVAGDAAAEQAIEVMAEMGIDLNDHVTQPLAPETASQADLLFVMTEGHRRQLAYLVPEVAGRVQLLRRDGGNVADPIGLDAEAYRETAQEIEQNLKPILADLVP